MRTVIRNGKWDNFNTATKIDNKYETGGLKATFRIKAKYRLFKLEF
jgi:hypothetical protein